MTAGTEALIAFVRARLDEERAHVEKVYGFWRADGAGNVVDASYASYIAVGPDGKGIDDASREHILRYGPERMLQENTAKRAILDRYEKLGKPATLAERALFPALREALLAVIADLAGVWTDHPDYGKQWDPALSPP